MAEIEKKLRSVLTPALFAPGRMPGHWKLRNRLLTLPAMTAIVVSLVGRQIPSLREVLRVLAAEGLLWQPVLTVSCQALSKRLARLPVALFASLFDQVVAAIQDSSSGQPAPPAPPPVLASVRERLSVLWIADGSTLEALKNKLGELKQQKVVLGGKIMMVVDAWTHQPIKTFYTAQSQANDKTFGDSLLQLLPARGLLIVDLGFFSFPFLDAFTAGGKFFLTRLREKPATKWSRGSVTALATGINSSVWERVGGMPAPRAARGDARPPTPTAFAIFSQLPSPPLVGDDLTLSFENGVLNPKSTEEFG